MTAKMQPFWWYLPPHYPQEPFYPAAWNYDDVIGAIWLQEQGGYDELGGEIYLSDPSAAITPQWGGCYDDRT